MSRSGYYRWLTRKDVRLEPRNQIDAEAEMLLVKSILDAYMKHSAFGYRKMGFYLRNQEGIENATEKRVRSIYERLGLKESSPQSKTTRSSKTKAGKYHYLLRNKSVAFVNQVWATDITYIKLSQGWFI